MPDGSLSSPARAALRWIALSLIFVFAGGLGAGVTALLYELFFPEPFGDVLYAVLFGGIGWVGVRVAEGYLRGRRAAP